MTVCIHHLRVAGWPHLREPSSIRVRHAGEDALAVIAHVVLTMRGSPGFGGDVSIGGLVSAVSASASRMVWVQVAETITGEALGVASLAGTASGHGRRWTIPFLLVSPAARRRGVATGLVRTSLQVAASRGAETATVETLSAWVDAQSFWRKVSGRLASAEGLADRLP